MNAIAQRNILVGRIEVNIAILKILTSLISVFIEFFKGEINIGQLNRFSAGYCIVKNKFCINNMNRFYFLSDYYKPQ